MNGNKEEHFISYLNVKLGAYNSPDLAFLIKKFKLYSTFAYSCLYNVH